MLLKSFLLLFIYFPSNQEGKEIHIPLCAAWNSTRTIIVGSEYGASGVSETLLNGPRSIVVDEKDAMYILDTGNNRLMKYRNGSNIGKEVKIRTETDNGTLNNPQDFAIGESGDIYISDTGNKRIVKWTIDPPNIEIIENINSPGNIYLNESTSDLYVVHGGVYPTVMYYDLTSLKRKKVAGDRDRVGPDKSLGNLNVPVGIYVDQNEKIFVAEAGNHRITRWSREKWFGLIVAGTTRYGKTLSHLNSPTSIIVDDTDTMYITDMNNHRILRWQKNAGQGECLIGCSSTNTSKRTNELNLPFDITFDSKLNLLVVESSMHRIQRFDFYFELACMLRYCKPPAISIKNYPAIHYRNQAILILINVELDCHIWLTTDMKCTVLACYPGDKSCKQTTKLDTIVNSFIIPQSFDFEIPPFGLPVGTYNFSCIIILTQTGLNSTFTMNLQIIRPTTIVTLLPLGKSQITVGYQQNYTFYPSISSINNNDNDYQNIKFVYYCRKYPNFNYSMIDGIRLNIDDDSKNPTSSTCFNLTALPQSFLYDDDTIRSSLTIMNRSLQVNQIYEFYVEMYDNRELVDKSDTVLVQIQADHSLFIQISTEFDTSILDNDYQLLNPSTQILLQSSCSNCQSNATIEWEIYQGTMDNDSIIQWEEYPDIQKYANEWFYGINSSIFTAINKLFSSNDTIDYWKFTAIYTDQDKHGSGHLQLKINHPPLKSNCSINPKNDSTSRIFTITCEEWKDLDGIKDYFLHVISMKSDIQMSIAHSNTSTFNVYLPSGDQKLDYKLRLIVHIRDMLGAWTESNVMEIKVIPNEDIVKEMLNFTEQSCILMKNLLLNNDHNQIINSFSIILNQMALTDQELLMNNSQVQISELIISTFEAYRSENSNSNDTNAATMFINNLKRRSNIREYLLNFYRYLSIPTTIEQIIILSSTINQLTSTSSEWTQTSLMIASEICNQVSKILHHLSRQITFEQITLVANSIAQCTSNIFTGVNAPLQNRGFIFNHNLTNITTIPSNDNDNQPDHEEYDEYDSIEINILHCNSTRLKPNETCKEIFIDNDDNSIVEILHGNFDLYQQSLLASKLSSEIDEALFLLSKSIRRHLNILQKFPIFYPVLRMLVEQIYQEDIGDYFIDLNVRNASIYLPKNLAFTPSNQFGIQSSLLPLASADKNVNVSLSTALTLSIIDNDDQEVQVNTTNNNTLIEMFIPRDVNIPIPNFNHQNMTVLEPPKYGSYKVNRQFFIHYINITQKNPNLTVSIHFHLKPSSNETSYAVIYKLDHVPSYNSTHHSFDGWTMFCHSHLVDDNDYHSFYVDNEKTAGHKGLFVGIRELDEQDLCSMNSLPKIKDKSYRFLNNYLIRIYSSGCYYLDHKRRWKSNGMKVGPKTNFEYTHCYSKHT